MYQVIFDNGRDRKTLYKNENFGKVLDEGWKLVRSGIPPAQIDILRQDESTGLWLSIWDYSECGLARPPLIIGLCSAGLVALTLIEYFIFPDPGPSTLLLLGIGIIVLIGAYHLFKH